MVGPHLEFGEYLSDVSIREVQLNSTDVRLDISESEGARSALVQINRLKEPLLLRMPIRGSEPKALRNYLTARSLSSIVRIDNLDYPSAIKIQLLKCAFLDGVLHRVSKFNEACCLPREWGRTYIPIWNIDG